MNYFDKKNVSELDRKVLEGIKEHGFFVISVAPKKGAEGPHQWFSYTIGLFATHKHPELIIFGLEASKSHDFLSLAFEQIQRGKWLEDGCSCSEIFRDHTAVFRTVSPESSREYLRFDHWFYDGDPFPAVQLFWPDAKGKFPWDPGVASDVADSQPQLQ